MSTQYDTKIIKQENGVTYEKAIGYNNRVRELPCIYINQDGLVGCIVRKKKLHQTVGDTTVDIYGMSLQFEPISPLEFQKSGAMWKQGDFFFPTPTYMVCQMRPDGSTLELSIHKLDTCSYNVIRFRNRTLYHYDAVIQRFNLDGINRVIFR